jgi:hypothetical protein
MRLSIHRTICAAWLLAFGLLAGSPAQNPRPCPIPSTEALPPTPPPYVPTPKERAAEAAREHSNHVARVEERAAYLELVAELAGKQGADSNDLDREDMETVNKRAKILRNAAKDKAKDKAK